MLSTNQIAKCFKLYYLKNYLRYNVHFLHVAGYPWKLQLNHVIFVGFGQACLGMPSVLQNNKAPISLGRVDLFYLFVACSYTSMETTVLSCCFSWVWSGMPKVLWKGLSDFIDFLHVIICILLDIHWSCKNMVFWAGIVRHRLSANQIVGCFELKILKSYMRYQVDFLLPLNLQKISCYFGLCCKLLLANQFAGFFTFDLFNLLILIPGVHC